eukprot:305724_1
MANVVNDKNGRNISDPEYDMLPQYYTYRHRRDEHRHAMNAERHFISDEQKESHVRRHSISSTTSNAYVLYQSAKDDIANVVCDWFIVTQMRHKGSEHKEEQVAAIEGV